MNYLDNAKKAEILNQALPYIRYYRGKTVVVKYGGAAMSDDNLKAAVMGDIVLLSLIGVRMVLVHGGGPEISAMLKKVGKQSKFIDGLRYTDEETRDIAQMVLAGKINKDLVAQVGVQGGKAVGLTGVDGAILTCERMNTGTDYGFVGDMKEVNTGLLNYLLDDGYIPVITSIGADKDGVTYNINADTMACWIASALGSESIILMTDTPGLLMDKDDASTLIPKVALNEVPTLVKNGVISGGMIPKIDCCVETVRRGVKKAIIIDGRIPHSILIEMLSDEGIGTLFYS